MGDQSFSGMTTSTAVLSETWRRRFIDVVWPNLPEEEEWSEPYQKLFRQFEYIYRALYPYEPEFASQGFTSIFNIIGIMRNNYQTMSQKDLILRIKADFPNTSDTAIFRLIQLAIRLWLCLSVYSEVGVVLRAVNPRETRIRWELDETLSDLIVAQFPVDRPLPTKNYLLDHSFNLARIRKTCRLHIRWTNNLTDHLRIQGQRGSRSLSVYQHKIFLLNHLNESHTVIPSDLLQETIRSLDILLPLAHDGTKKLLNEFGMSYCGSYERSRAYDLEEFKYWGTRLGHLFELYQGPPESLIQTLTDTRNLAQWAGLWIAVFGIFILTLVFGILATIYTIKQYRVAVLAYEVSVKSFELALAVACQGNATSLPGFC